MAEGITVIEFLQEKFRETGYATVTDWMADSRVHLSLQSCTAVLLRGQDKGLIVMLALAVALGCTPEEIRWVAQEKGDKVLWRLFANEVITNDESKLLEDYRTLAPAQKRMVKSMIKEMVPKEGVQP